MTKPYFANPSNEENFKILKVECLINHLLDPAPILNLSLDDQTILYKSFKRRRPQNIKSGISFVNP